MTPADFERLDDLRKDTNDLHERLSALRNASVVSVINALEAARAIVEQIRGIYVGGETLKIVGCIILALMGAGFSNSTDWKDVWALTVASAVCYLFSGLLLLSEIGWI